MACGTRVDADWASYISIGAAYSRGNEQETQKEAVMKKQLVAGLLFAATVITGCGRPDIAQREPTATSAESPISDADIADETLDRMLEVARNGDWEAYVDDYYGEQHKFRSPADRDELVQRFEDKWGAELIQVLSRAAKLPAQVEGDKAVFMDGADTVFILHHSESGVWKFHL